MELERTTVLKTIPNDLEQEKQSSLEYQTGKIVKVYFDEVNDKWYIDTSVAYSFGLVDFNKWNKSQMSLYQEQFNEWLNSECERQIEKNTSVTSGHYSEQSVPIRYEDFAAMFNQLYPVSKEFVSELKRNGYVIVYVMVQPKLEKSHSQFEGKDEIINEYINSQNNINVMNFGTDETLNDDLNNGFKR